MKHVVNFTERHRLCVDVALADEDDRSMGIPPTVQLTAGEGPCLFHFDMVAAQARRLAQLLVMAAAETEVAAIEDRAEVNLVPTSSTNSEECCCDDCHNKRMTEETEQRRDTTAWAGPDWSKAPEWADWWAADAGRDGVPNTAYWYRRKPNLTAERVWAPLEYGSDHHSEAPLFGYARTAADSLRERPIA